MIEFKIIATPDKSQQSTYQHLGRELTLGQNEGDMIIDDPAIGSLQIKIYQSGSGFLLDNLNPEVEVRLNGKAVSDPTPIKERDNLNMGRTTINFSRIDTADFTVPNPYEHPQTTNRVTPGSKEKAILDSLEVLEKAAGGNGPNKAPPAPGSRPPLPPGAPPPPKKF